MSDADLLHRLIGCDWGHKFGDPRDPAARQVVV